MVNGCPSKVTIKPDDTRVKFCWNRRPINKDNTGSNEGVNYIGPRKVLWHRNKILINFHINQSRSANIVTRENKARFIIKLTNRDTENTLDKGERKLYKELFISEKKKKKHLIGYNKFNQTNNFLKNNLSSGITKELIEIKL